MKRLFRIILFTLFNYFPFTDSVAQLTVFNVSSSDITDAGKTNVQQQLEVEDEIESSTTMTYGLGRKWEMGLNLINLDYGIKSHHFEANDTSFARPFAPLLLVNAQKGFEINKTFSVGIGAVAGTNLSGHANFVYYGYSNLLAAVGSQDQYAFAAGPYISNHKFLSDGPVYGVQAAFDAGIWYKKFHFWVTGFLAVIKRESFRWVLKFL